MKWVSSIAVSTDFTENVDSCVREIMADLGTAPDLAIVFVSPHFHEDYEQIGRRLRERLHCSHLIGCSAGAVIGAGKEVEGMPGMSVTAGMLPGVKLIPSYREHQELPSLDGSPRPWEELFGVTAREEPHFLILADPFSVAPEEWLSGLDFAFPGAAKIGGLASAASNPGENVLYLEDRIYRKGLVGMVFTGDIVLDTAVA
ncbi:MAG: FIST N-terminal domain-containing protein, partial [bacterium]|nr:FIST N-terminal domain-containing protein [bacterium]